MVSFENTLNAFAGKSDNQLKKAYRLFYLIKYPILTKAGSFLLAFSNRFGLPVKWVLKNTVFEHFCGGETIEECKAAIRKLSDGKIKSILDYAAEGIDNDKMFEEAKNRIIDTIYLAKENPDIGFAVFKFSGIGSSILLSKVSSQATLTKNEQQEYRRIKQRAEEICHSASAMGVPVMIDAEETWIQNAIDEITEELMAKYNRVKPVVFHTLQLYRTDKLFYLNELTKTAIKDGYVPGYKLVRGAYMEKEWQRAQKLGYKSPVYPDKESTDKAFNEALRFCIEKIDHVAVCLGTHNEDSCRHAIHSMEINNLPNNHPRIHFSQLLGMSDHISYNLSKAGYNVSKYVPYGPIKLAIPYLLRRAQENSSVKGQTSRELLLIEKELLRRKKEKKEASLKQ